MNTNTIPTATLTVKILPNDNGNPPGKLADAELLCVAIDIMRGHDHHARRCRSFHRRRKDRGVRRVDGAKAEVDHIHTRFPRQIDRAH